VKNISLTKAFISILAVISMYSTASVADTWTPNSLDCIPDAKSPPSITIKLTYLESVVSHGLSGDLNGWASEMQNVRLKVSGPGVTPYEGAAVGYKFYSVPTDQGQMPPRFWTINLSTPADLFVTNPIDLKINWAMTAGGPIDATVVYAGKTYYCAPHDFD